MSSGIVDLKALLFDFSAVSEEEIEKKGEMLFHQEFITRHGKSGMVVAHDGEEVTFFADRYHHAFHTSRDRARLPYSKGKVAFDRIERIRWIRPIIEGLVVDIECWEVPLKVPEEGIRCFPGKRLYVSWKNSYVIWLEPLRKGGFKFSTAYPLPPTEIDVYIKRSRRVIPSARS